MKFSITIPAYKSCYLDEAIKSVVNQTYENWELVIVDDCSPEDLCGIVMPYLSDRRISYYHNEKNCGAIDVVDNWNICLSYCTGDHVICMGDDDRLLPNCLADYRALIERHPDLNVYHTRTEIIDERGNVIDLQEQRPEWESALSLIWNRWDHRNRQYIGDFCYKRAYLESAGGYHKLPLAWGSDDITAVKAAKEKGIANTQTFGFQYRQNNQTISNSKTNAKIKIEATLMQHHWYSLFISEQTKKRQIDSDQLYLETIEKPRTLFFRAILGIYCSEFINGNLVRLFLCIKRLKQYNIPKALFIKWYMISIYQKFR